MYHALISQESGCCDYQVDFYWHFRDGIQLTSLEWFLQVGAFFFSSAFIFHILLVSSDCSASNSLGILFLTVALPWK